MPQERKASNEERRRSDGTELVDDYGFSLGEEDGEEDMGGLTLMRTQSRRPVR